MFLRKKATASPSGSPEFMVVGLGNPGRDYEFTRHNAGFLTLDHIAVEENVEIKKLKYKALIGDTVISGHRCLLVKPQTFMNNSGEAVREISQFYKIPPEKIIVIFDDISLPCGKLRIRRKGTDGGHNGIKSIIYHLNSDNFPRIKVGVGAKPHPDYNLADWVLSTFKKDEMEELKKAIVKATEVLPYMLDGEIDKAMNKAN
ncbi:MAG: aminoacyl-tRNA hydrolase [Acutalibacteraceae bacterium]|nr:aminoacyl-tRNA hydrolase [Acutalibacteraceae bacterium]